MEIKNASDKMAFWEGAQLAQWNMCPEPVLGWMDGWRAMGQGWGHKFYEPNDSESWDSYARQPDLGPNQDGDYWYSAASMRFRHLKNTAGPVAYFDGHVDVRKPAEITVRDLCITPP